MTNPTSPAVSYIPRRPHLAALGVVTVFIAILAIPMLSGRWLASPDGDQYFSGYAVKVWAKNAYHETGTFPLWNPMIMVGLPHIDVVTHGDVLYPTSALRFVMPVYQAMNLAFVIHYILAGFLMYLFLSRLGASWIGAVTGGVAYQLTGLIISYVHPGHDGKLFVSTMLPLACLAVLAALRDKRTWGYPLLAIAVALCLLSPHVQTTYYLLIATALFALYLTFGEPSADPLTKRAGRLALTLVAVIVGFGIAAPQILPFIQYIPHSPRAGGYAVGYEGTTSYGIPWNHIPEFIIAGFTGDTETYWGSNPLKLHSEYLGLPVVALAILGFGDRRRRLVWWTAGIGALFLLIALGAATPFYHLWWAVMPFVKKTRAPGMVFFVVAFCTAIFAAFGVDRIERREDVAARAVRVWLIASAVIALLGLAGVFGQLAVALAPAAELAQAYRHAPPQAHANAIRLSTMIGAVLFAAVALLAWGWIKGRAPILLLALGLPLLVGVDLWRNGQHFWMYSPRPDQGAYRSDALITRLQTEPKPSRVLNLDAYPSNVLMAFGIPQVLGYQGSELRYFDDLIGGRPGTANAARLLFSSTRLWHLLAARYVIIGDTANLPGYHRVMGPVTTGAGTQAFLYEADTVPPYVRVVPAAAKVPEEAIPPTLADPRLPGYDRVVLFSQDVPISPRPVTTLPPPSASRGQITAWSAGRMSIVLDPPPTDSSYVLIAENWYLDWSATVDGQPGRVLRGDNSLLTVPVAAGARRLELSYHSRVIRRGVAIGLVSLLVAIAGFLVPPAWRRRPRSA